MLGGAVFHIAVVLCSGQPGRGSAPSAADLGCFGGCQQRITPELSAGDQLETLNETWCRSRAFFIFKHHFEPVLCFPGHACLP